MGSRVVVIHEADVPEESWGDPTRGGVVWRTLVSGDRTPSESLTLGVAEVPPGEEAPTRHRHAPPEVYYLLSGTGVVEVDGEEHAVRTGSAVFIPGDAVHRLRNTGDTTLRLLYVFPVSSFSDVEYVFPEEG